MGYGLYKTLPQANALNPALLPDYKFTLSLPGLAGFKANASQNFTNFSLLTAKNGDGAMDLEGIFEKLRRNNRTTANLAVPLFNLGIRSQHGYTAFSVTTRSFSRFSFPRELANLAYFGNANDETRALSFDRLALKSNTFSEIGLSHGREILKGKMTIGASIKYLIGHSYLDLADFNLALNTFNDDSIRISTQGLEGRIAGPAALALIDDVSDRDLNNSIFTGSGLGVDVGATYQFSEKINLFASINDLGFIRWSGPSRSHAISATAYTFKGADLLDESPEDEFTEEFNRLEKEFEESERINEPFSNALTANIYLGGSYKLSKKQTASAILYAELYKGTLVPAFSGMYNVQFKTFFNFIAGFTAMNGRVNNIGTGFTLNLIPFQINLVTNDLLSLVNPMKGRAADLRVGINFTFGNVGRIKTKNKRKSKNTIDNIDLGLD